MTRNKKNPKFLRKKQYFKLYSIAGLICLLFVINVNVSTIHVNSNLDQSGKFKITSNSSINQNSSVNSNIIGDWNFNEGNGTVAYDSSGYNHSFVLQGPTYESGINMTGLHFNGVNDFASVNTEYFTNTSLTISVWLDPSSTNDQIAVSQATNDNGFISFTIGIKNGNWFSEVDNGSLVPNYWDNVPVTLNKWSHIVIVKDINNSKVDFYYNGVLNSQISWNGTNNYQSCSTSFPCYPLTIGKMNWNQTNPTYHYNGLLDELAIYNTSLSASEIGNLYNSTVKYFAIDEHFSQDNFALTNWNRSDSSVFVNATTGTLDINSNGINNSWAQIPIPHPLAGEPIYLEYRAIEVNQQDNSLLPTIYLQSALNTSRFDMTYRQNYGWEIDATNISMTTINSPGPNSTNQWWDVKAVIYQSHGLLYDKQANSSAYNYLGNDTWNLKDPFTKILVMQPADSTIKIDWISLYTTANSSAYFVPVTNSTTTGTGNGTNASVPTVPLNFSYTYSNGSIRLTWNAPISDGGSSIIKYNIYRQDPSALSMGLFDSSTSLYYLDIAVQSGFTYHYQVSAVNSVGEGPLTTILYATAGITTNPTNQTTSIPNQSTGASNKGSTTSSYSSQPQLSPIGTISTSTAPIPFSAILLAIPLAIFMKKGHKRNSK